MPIYYKGVCHLLNQVIVASLAHVPHVAIVITATAVVDPHDIAAGDPVPAVALVLVLAQGLEFDRFRVDLNEWPHSLLILFS